VQASDQLGAAGDAPLRRSDAREVDGIEFDSESDMFCARSADRTALVKLGEVLAEAARSPKVLTKLLGKVPPSLRDD
jgi:hypothetical protein